MKRFGWARICQYVLALFGAVLLVASCTSLAEGWLFQWRPQLFANGPAIAKTQSPAASEDANVIPPLPTLVVRDPSVNCIRVVGRFEIQRLHVSTLVVEGDGQKALRLGVGHVPGTALAGPHGNTVLAGHRDTFFRCLRNIQIGDELVLDVAGNPNRYRVTGTQIVSPSDVAVMKSSGARRLTLITCYPFAFIGSAPKRFVVEAKPLRNRAL